jgi:CxxC motif-containing protein (DUF1111 family)
MSHYCASGKWRLWTGIVMGLGVYLVWFFCPGLADVLRARRVKPEADGKMLFEHQWVQGDRLADGDGLGPVYNARSCVACHFQGGVGGAGTNQCNVLTFEMGPTGGGSKIRTGVIHNFATRASLKEGSDTLPLVRMESINTTALFGVGLIDRISDRDIKANCRKVGRADASGKLPPGPVKGVAGRVRILPDGRVGKFGWRAQFATLEEFVAAACANEIGLGTPRSAQGQSLRETNGPSVRRDLDERQFAALCGFVDSLPRPVRKVPHNSAERLRAERGEAVFHKIGCATCHTPDLGGVQGVYSDFLLHRVGYYGGNSTPAGPVAAGDTLVDEWKTPPLWGVADSAPYFHDGASATLQDAILRHGGEAKEVKETYTRLRAAEQEQLLAFLRTLKAPPNAAPAHGPGAELQRPGLPLQPPDWGNISGSDW